MKLPDYIESLKKRRAQAEREREEAFALLREVVGEAGEVPFLPAVVSSGLVARIRYLLGQVGEGSANGA